jgi:hypothetical protein
MSQLPLYTKLYQSYTSYKHLDINGDCKEDGAPRSQDRNDDRNSKEKAVDFVCRHWRPLSSRTAFLAGIIGIAFHAYVEGAVALSKPTIKNIIFASALSTLLIVTTVHYLTSPIPEQHTNLKWFISLIATAAALFLLGLIASLIYTP